MQVSTDPATHAAPQTLAGTVRITSIEAIPFALPYRRAPRFASGSVSSADNVLVRVHSDAGLVGQAEAQPRPYTYGETQASIVDTVGGPLDEALRVSTRCASNSSLSAVPALPATTSRAARSTSPSGTSSARSSAARVHTLLGGFADDVAAAHMISFGDPAAMADEAVEINEALGVTTFKVKVGRAPDLDVAAVARSGDALPDADLYVDANRGWNYDDAVRAGGALIELGVRVIEEPISTDDRAGRLRLARALGVPLGGDESCISLAHVDRALEEGAVRMVSVKTARTGFTESRRIRSLPRPKRPRRRRQPVRGSDRRHGDDRVRRGVRRHRRTAGRDHELPRPRRRSRRRQPRDPRRSRDGPSRARPRSRGRR